jgi:urea ABC transporter ATP-binding protein UrtE
MLELDGVDAGYGRVAVLHGMTLSLAEADTVAVLGRNGVGKTTMLRAITGEIPIGRGEITIAGDPARGLPASTRARRGLAYVPQGREIFSRLTVAENLRVAAYPTAGRRWREVVDEVLVDFPLLAERRGQRGGTLSGGQQQLLAVARALATRPRLLLLDEPSEGVQPSLVMEMADHVRDLAVRRGLTVLVVEQNLDCAARIADRAYVVDGGRVVAELATAELLQNRELQHTYLGV